ncbi:MAG: ABC transporter substrate-binding protein [Alphaproteobacteria bacterium]|nr:ABC transporter substrate-binding protein [Alphaproteobacteria bacterium]MDP6589931.1 ABC transporter substrate-binding protein [Alphaproteobacteria bacterium]MDP6816887.1 ABC transporter substrate-binding protein [Alphaproteobacteria bacterium]|tara:strand:- start:3448 stop:4629 length:1182 start_codon:yes stop_codon:yes gene_type:complete
MKRLTLLAMAGLLALGVAGFAGQSQAEDPIVIGAAIAMSGFVQPYDDGPLKGAQLAIADINAKGGVLGRQLKIITADTKSDPAQGTNAAIEVLEQGAEMVIVTCDFDFGAAAALQASASGKVTFSSCAGDPKFGVQGIGPLAYTMSLGTPAQGATLAEWAYKEKGWRKAYVEMDSMVEYFKSLCANFKIRWAELGGEVVGEDVYNFAEVKTFDGQVTRMKASSDADFVFLCAATFDGPALIKQARAAGVETPILASSSMDGAFWLEAVPNLSEFYLSVYASMFGNDPDPAINDYVARYTAMHGVAPITGDSLTGYSLIEAWVIAAERAGSFDADAIRQELDKFDNEPLLIGPTTYTPDLHINLFRGMQMMEVQNGKHAPIMRYTAEKVPPITF